MSHTVLWLIGIRFTLLPPCREGYVSRVLFVCLSASKITSKHACMWIEFDEV